LLVEQEIVLELQPQRSQKRKCQEPMGGDLGWKQDVSPINKPTFPEQVGRSPNLKIMEDLFFSINFRQWDVRRN
jgi:hypothetical protein